MQISTPTESTVSVKPQFFKTKLFQTNNFHTQSRYIEAILYSKDKTSFSESKNHKTFSFTTKRPRLVDSKNYYVGSIIMRTIANGSRLHTIAVRVLHEAFGYIMKILVQLPKL